MEHLGRQVLDQQKICAGGRLDRRTGVAGALERDRDQLQARRPSIRPLDQRRTQVALEGLPTDRPDQRQGALLVEGQVPAAQFDEFTL